MTDLITRLTLAIFRQEGEPPTALNPGNLRFAPWLLHPVIRDGFWVPGSRAEGVAGAVHCVALRVAEGQSLRQLVTAWAPPQDHNKTEKYIANVKEWAKVPDENVALYMYLV